MNLKREQEHENYKLVLGSSVNLRRVTSLELTQEMRRLILQAPTEF